MGILNLTNHGYDTDLLLLWEDLVRNGPTEENALIARLRPDSLGQEKRHLEHTLSRWVNLGVFAKEGDAVSIAQGAPADISKSDPYRLAFRSYALHRATVAPGTSEEVEGGKDSSDSTQLAGDFCVLAAWLLAQDCYTFNIRGWDVSQRLVVGEGRLGEASPLHVNQSRWSGMRRWMPFFGLASELKGQVLDIDPTPAVLGFLPALLAEEETVSVAEFMKRLADHCPLFDHGVFRRVIADRLGERFIDAAENTVSPSLSRALSTAELLGAIKLEMTSDTKEGAYSLLGADRQGFRPITHVRREVQK